MTDYEKMAMDFKKEVERRLDAVETRLNRQHDATEDLIRRVSKLERDAHHTAGKTE
jgi:hypothetical protein